MELPGMWEESDFTGGQDEERPATDAEVGTGQNPYDGKSLEELSAVMDSEAYRHSDRRLPVRKADAAQYEREPIPEEQRGRIRVRLLNATPDPLGSIAALCEQYKGHVVRSLSEVTDEQRRACLDDMSSTVLNGPLEAAQFHFQIEGVTRSITHQMVRSRASFFAQESLRFAVPEGNWSREVPLPPWLLGAERDSDKIRRMLVDPEYKWAPSNNHDLAIETWETAITHAQDAYERLIELGMPAEEARGVLPHDMPTRIHWVLDLRTLLQEAGKRTCTQAQFPWRLIFAGMAKALREYGAQRDWLFRQPVGGFVTGYRDMRGDRYETNEPIDQLRSQHGDAAFIESVSALGLAPEDGWQFEEIADRLRPVCYQTGQCGFMAKFDRNCSIRSRVDRYAAAGVPSSEWGNGIERAVNGDSIPPIRDYEWAANPDAARS